MNIVFVIERSQNFYYFKIYGYVHILILSICYLFEFQTNGCKDFCYFSKIGEWASGKIIQLRKMEDVRPSVLKDSSTHDAHLFERLSNLFGTLHSIYGVIGR